MKFKKDFGGRENYFPTKLKKDLAGDCIMRAIPIATGIDYKVIWDGMFELGSEIGRMPNSWVTMDLYLDSLGWKKCKPFRKSNGRKYKLKDVPIRFCHVPGEAFLFRTSKHLTAVVNGELRDVWNCKESYANSYYVKENKDKTIDSETGKDYVNKFTGNN